MGGACNTLARDEMCIQNFGLKTLKGRDNSEVLDVDGNIILL
jgi:hypothetical protein